MKIQFLLITSILTFSYHVIAALPNELLEVVGEYRVVEAESDRSCSSLEKISIVTEGDNGIGIQKYSRNGYMYTQVVSEVNTGRYREERTYNGITSRVRYVFKNADLKEQRLKYFIGPTIFHKYKDSERILRIISQTKLSYHDFGITYCTLERI